MRFYLILLFLFPANVFAGDIDVRKQIIEGKEYACFGEKDANKLMDLRMNFPKVKSWAAGLNKLVIIRAQEINTLNVLNVNLQSQIKKLTDVNKRLQKQITTADAWWKSPYFWFVVGLGVGGASVIIVVHNGR